MEQKYCSKGHFIPNARDNNRCYLCESDRGVKISMGLLAIGVACFLFGIFLSLLSAVGWISTLIIIFAIIAVVAFTKKILSKIGDVLEYIGAWAEKILGMQDDD